MTSNSIHFWTINGRVVGHFIYKCKRCGCTTLSGEALKAPYDKVCK